MIFLKNIRILMKILMFFSCVFCILSYLLVLDGTFFEFGLHLGFDGMLSWLGNLEVGWGSCLFF